MPAVGHLQSRDRQLTADMVYKIVKKLLRDWEENTERLIDAVQPTTP